MRLEILVGEMSVSIHEFVSQRAADARVYDSVQFFIIYVLSRQPQGQLQTQHSVDKSSYILDKQHKVKD
jgi:hypothetical protein